MKSFVDLDRHFGRLPIDVVDQLTAIANAQGQQDIFRRQRPQGLETLRQIARIQSAEASNAIENITAPRGRIEALVKETTEPRDRTEQEIAGYRYALDLIHGSGSQMTFAPTVVRQVHAHLGRFTGARDAGHWKSNDNVVEEEHPDGSKVVRFRPVAAIATPAMMDALHEATNQALATQKYPHLLLSSAYLLDFLTIHPFRDGNGRMSRLITTWLLYLGDMDVGRYISLEKIIESTKEDYYANLKASTERWHDADHDLLPWTRYFLGVVLAAYRQFVERSGMVGGGIGSKRALVEGFIKTSIKAHFTVEDVRNAAPGVSDAYINKIFGELKASGVIEREGAGRGSRWKRLKDDW